MLKEKLKEKGAIRKLVNHKSKVFRPLQVRGFSLIRDPICLITATITNIQSLTETNGLKDCPLIRD